MPWRFRWLPFIFFLNTLFHVSDSERSGSKPIAVWSSLQSNFYHSRLKRELKENITVQNFTSAPITDGKLTSETEHLNDSNSTVVTDTVVYNSTHNVPSWMIPIKSGALQRTGFLVLGFMVIILLFFVVRSVRYVL